MALPFNHDGIAEVLVDGKVGFIDKTGSYLVVPQFDGSDGRWGSGLVDVLVGGPNGKWGYVDRTGHIRINPIYTAAHPFMDGYAYVETDKHTGFYIDPSGNHVDSALARASRYNQRIRSDDAEFFLDDATVKYGIRSHGRILADPQFDSAAFFDNCTGLGAVRIGDDETGAWGLVDRNGRFVVNPQYSDVIPASFEEGLLPVRVGHGSSARWGFIDPTGNMVISAAFESAAYFSEGLAAVIVGGKKGFVGHDGRFVIPPIFEVGQFGGQTAAALGFAEGLAPVSVNGKWGYIAR